MAIFHYIIYLYIKNIMRLILNESQYDRIFNKNKRKLVITENQYNKLLFESKSSNSLLGVDKSDAIVLVTGNNKLYFKVVSKSGNEFIMINCNDGVYKNAYFHIKGDSLSKNSLTYYIAQNSAIDSSNPWGTIGSSIWRKSTFKNVSVFDVYKDSGEGLTCNLSDTSSKKFGIDMDTGSIVNSDDKKDGEEEVDLSDENKLIKVFNTKHLTRLSTDYKFVIDLADVEGITGGIKIRVLNRRGNIVDFEIIDVYGQAGEHYRDLMDSELKFIMDKSNIEVNMYAETYIDVKTNRKKTRQAPMFSLSIEQFKGKNDDGGRDTEKQIIANVIGVGKGVKVTKGDDDGENGYEGPTDDEIKEFFKKFIADEDGAFNDKLIQKALYRKPNQFFELLGLAKKRGIVPAQEWIAFKEKSEKGTKNIFYNDFKGGSDVTASFLDLKINSDENTSLKENLNIICLVGEEKKQSKYVDLYTNFNDSGRSPFKYKISILRQVENTDKYNTYKVILSSKKDVKSSFNRIGEGRIKINKKEKK